MRFEWDSRKDQANFEKHAIWFDEAETVWEDLKAVILFDSVHSLLEDRFYIIGHSYRARVLLVVFSERHDGETTRIISARRAILRERRVYEERI